MATTQPCLQAGPACTQQGPVSDSKRGPGRRCHIPSPTLQRSHWLSVLLISTRAEASVDGRRVAVTDAANKSWRLSAGTVWRSGVILLPGQLGANLPEMSGCPWTIKMSLCLASGALISPGTTVTNSASLQLSANMHEGFLLAL